MLALLEGLAVRLAAPRLTAEDLRVLQKIVETMKAASGSGDVEELVRADAEFHDYLIVRSQNRRLHRALTDLRAHAERFEYLFFSSKKEVRASLRQHERLVQILKRRDARAAQRHMVKQWDFGGRALLRLIRDQHPAGQNLPVLSPEVLKRWKTDS